MHNFAVEQTAGSRSLARGCSPRRWADQTRCTPVDGLSARPRMARDKPLR